VLGKREWRGEHGEFAGGFRSARWIVWLFMSAMECVCGRAVMMCLSDPVKLGGWMGCLSDIRLGLNGSGVVC